LKGGALKKINVFKIGISLDCEPHGGPADHARVVFGKRDTPGAEVFIILRPGIVKFEDVDFYIILIFLRFRPELVYYAVCHQVFILRKDSAFL